MGSEQTMAKIGRLNPEAFERCFVAWVAELAQVGGRPQLRIDGKTLCHNFAPRSLPRRPRRRYTMVRAWASHAGLTLGRVACDAKSNEITAIPKLLELIGVHDAVVTIDATPGVWGTTPASRWRRVTGGSRRGGVCG
jgi:hypothetical protein